MKVIAVVFAFLLAGVCAKPNLQSSKIESAIRSGNERLTVNSITSAIQDLADSIVEAGLDPWTTEDVEIDYALLVPSVFNARAQVRGVESAGLSNIVVNRMNYALLTNRLTFNIELPAVGTKVDDSAWDVNVLSGRLSGSLSGSVAVKNVVVSGEARINIGILSGITLRSVDVNFRVGNIDSNVNLILQGVDVSDVINNFLGERVPNAIAAYQTDIDNLLTTVARDFLEANL